MLSLTLAMLCSALVSVVMRLGAQGDQPRKPMLAVNYLTCFAVSLFFLRRGAGGTGLGTAAGLGLLGGILYLGAFLLLPLDEAVYNDGNHYDKKDSAPV